MVIVLAGRRAHRGDRPSVDRPEKIVFAYSMAGLLMGYVYFSIPRTILTVMATAEKLDPKNSRKLPDRLAPRPGE